MYLKDFSKFSKIKEETILRRLNDIPGWKKIDNVIVFLEGTRYPYERNKVRINDTLDRYYAILKATDRSRFIDHTYLNITKDNFNLMLDELVRIDYLQKNNSNNPYGANSYEMTFLSANEIKKT